MVINSAWSDRAMKRQMFVVAPAILGAIGLIGGQFMHAPALRLLFLVIAAVGVYSPFGPFWAVPSAILRVEVTGAAMGLINIGNLGGFLGPYIVGALRGATDSGFAGFLVLGAFLLIVAGIFLFLGSDKRSAQTKKQTTQPQGFAGQTHQHGGHA